MSHACCLNILFVLHVGFPSFLAQEPWEAGALSILLTEQRPSIGQGLVRLDELKETAVSRSVQTMG